MNKEQRMYVEVEAREDYITIEGNESKFYPHPTLDGVYASRNGEVARKRVKSGKILLVPTRNRKDGYVDVKFPDKTPMVHQVVLETFVPKPDTEQDWVVDHINDKRYDNRLQNLQWLTRIDNLRKRDEAGSLNKSTYVYDRVTDTVTEYDSRLEAAEAINYFVSNMVTAMKKDKVIRGRYFVTDTDHLLPEDYYYIFREEDLKKELKEANAKKKEVIVKSLTDEATYKAAQGAKWMVK